MSHPFYRAALALCTCAVLLGAAGPVRAESGERVLVFGAASLRGALDEVARAFEARTGTRVIASYAGSSALARQIERGAPADIFISADQDWMTFLKEKRLIRSGTRVPLLTNRLVLIAPAASTARLEIKAGFDLAGALGGGRLALADVDAVPAGKYARAALEALGVWRAVAPRVVRAANVRAALAFVARGEAPFGIVYRTDALAEPRVRIVGLFPEGLHAPIVYPAAIVSASRSPAARAFLDFLDSPAAEKIWRRHGFGIAA